MEAEPLRDYHERRCDTGAESDVYEYEYLLTLTKLTFDRESYFLTLPSLRLDKNCLLGTTGQNLMQFYTILYLH